MPEDDGIESARSAFVRRVAARLAGMHDVSTAESIINDELARLLNDMAGSDLLDLDALDQIDDEPYAGLAELDRLSDED